MFQGRRRTNFEMIDDLLETFYGPSVLTASREGKNRLPRTEGASDGHLNCQASIGGLLTEAARPSGIRCKRRRAFART